MENNNTKSHSVLLYNTQNIDAQRLKAGFSIRKKEYQRIWKDIQKGSMKNPETHYLIQGVRGAGKTTLLSRIAYDVAEDDTLNKWLIPILLNEEEYGILSLFTFWLRIAEKLAEQSADIYTELFEHVSSLDDSAEIAWELIQSHLNKNKQKIIVFVDNLGELFKDFDDTEHAQLREVLSLHPQIRLIGGSSQLLEAHFDGAAPFYQFFKLVNLKPINEAEMHELLRSLAKQNGQEAIKTIEEIIIEHPERIEAVRRLTDGVPRTIVLLFQIIMEGAKESSYAYLEETIDKTTPLYKHRMDDLSRQQKAIVHTIAMNWDAMSTKEIAEQTRLPSKTVSAQLVKLQKQWIIDKVETDTKNHLYIVKERFFNIWYLMRYGNQNDKRRVLWLTRFLESWYGDKNLSNILVEVSYKLSTQADNRASQMLLDALLASEKIDNNIKKIMALSQFKNVKSIDFHDTDAEYEELIQNIKRLTDQGEDRKLFDLLEENLDKLTILEYLVYSHTLFVLDSIYFDSLNIILRLFTEKNTGFIEGIHIFEIVFHFSLNGYKKELFQVMKNSNFDEGASWENLPFMSLYSIYCLWNNELEKFIEVIDKVFEKQLLSQSPMSKVELSEDRIRITFFEDILLFLLAKNQYEAILNILDKFGIKEYFKPIYYATVSLLKDERQQEYLRMGPELQGTVDEILQKVEEFRVKYA